MIVSFHPCFVGERNILCAGRDPDGDDLAAIQQARAVILPQGCRSALYRMARDNCPHVFPNYEARFRYPGKLGQIRLLRKMEAPHPPTMLFERVSHLNSGGFSPDNPPLDYPFVLKFAWGGEGDTVFLIRSPSDLRDLLDRAEAYERTGQCGLMVQAYVPTGNRTLRVVVIHQRVISYWRIGPRADGFYANVSKGGSIDHDLDPERRALAETLVKRFCRQTGINLAGFDVIYSTESGTSDPLLLEINYFFGRQGLGGSERYYDLLTAEIAAWIAAIDQPAEAAEGG